ncbi:MAG: hypothetical protein ACRD96_29515, partial [Bryobacteraceae bacterium]
MMRIALGFRVHSGWAAVVAVSESREVLDRWRIEIADPKIPGSVQPYHAAQPRKIAAASDYLRRCEESASRLALEALTALVAEVPGVTAAGVLVSSARPLPPLESILASHPLLHTAEGVHFREAVIRAAERLGLRVSRVVERGVAVDPGLDAAGRALGPPWRQDQKLAATAAW